MEQYQSTEEKNCLFDTFAYDKIYPVINNYWNYEKEFQLIIWNDYLVEANALHG